MIFSAFDMKFQEKKDEIPPRACRPSKKLKQNNVEQVDPTPLKQNNVEKVDPQQVETKQCRTSGLEAGQVTAAWHRRAILQCRILFQEFMVAVTVLWPRSVLRFSFACGTRPSLKEVRGAL